MVQQPIVGQGLLSIQASRPHSAGPLWTMIKPNAAASTWQLATFTREIHAPVWFEPAISASERKQTHTLDGAAVRIRINLTTQYFLLLQFHSCKLTKQPEISPGRSTATTKRKELLHKNTRMYNNGTNYVQNYIEVSLYTQRTSSCFRQPTDHLQGCKIQRLNIIKYYMKSDVWLTVHRNSVWIRKTN